MKKLSSIFATGAFLAITSVAVADEPVMLSETEMDNVTAAGTANAAAQALANGFIFSATQTLTQSNVQALQVIPTQGGQLVLTVSSSQAQSAASAF
ncbi:hypothetical protein Nhal_0137 [Nitrosococcus halophilus Nc 4]|uniref:Uncharacterized protein n=1 Tax=Nitrosococcus halophilus (strain Nc4) TaxID=472759 RepID=D5C4T1_NITHN|nr:hypothetical protein [Nitrosococcus halophilus]ADE13354.1 hypothetical protein Nhal_0137 [Nitrosococcus halophilus Nc 4]